MAHLPDEPARNSFFNVFRTVGYIIASFFTILILLVFPIFALLVALGTWIIEKLRRGRDDECATHKKGTEDGKKVGSSFKKAVKFLPKIKILPSRFPNLCWYIKKGSDGERFTKNNEEPNGPRYTRLQRPFIDPIEMLVHWVKDLRWWLITKRGLRWQWLVDEGILSSAYAHDNVDIIDFCAEIAKKDETFKTHIFTAQNLERALRGYIFNSGFFFGSSHAQLYFAFKDLKVSSAVTDENIEYVLWCCGKEKAYVRKRARTALNDFKDFGVDISGERIRRAEKLMKKAEIKEALEREKQEREKQKRREEMRKEFEKHIPPALFLATINIIGEWIKEKFK